MTFPVAVSLLARFSLGALICGAAICGIDVRAASAQTADVAACPLDTGPARTVTSVFDAETIALDDGSEVRLAGILAPRPPLTAQAPAIWPPEVEATAALSRLVLGRPIFLGFSGRRNDRYGRLVAQVFVDDGNGGRTWVQGRLLTEGHARANVLPEHAVCIEGLLAEERLARETNKGLWSNPAFAVRDAARSFELSRRRSTYQIVSGRVAKIANIKGRIYLNFGTDWRRDFTAGVTRKTQSHEPGWSAKLQALEGRRVTVRGWIERRNGPFIEIGHPRQVEILDDDEKSAPAPVPLTTANEPSP